MLTIEDCLEKLHDISIASLFGKHNNLGNVWDNKFIADMAGHVQADKPISTAQAELAVKLVQRYRDELLQNGLNEQSLDQLIYHPIYRRPLYQSTPLPREVRWIGNNQLAFRCRFNAAVVEDLKKLKSTTPFRSNALSFFANEKIWVIAVDDTNWQAVMNLIKRHSFAFDDNVANYFLEVENSLEKLSSIAVEDDQLVIQSRNNSFLDNWLDAMVALER